MAAVEAPEASDETSAPAQPENLDPLAYMLRVMNDPGAEPERRDRMAIAAAPFMHPVQPTWQKAKRSCRPRGRRRQPLAGSLRRHRPNWSPDKGRCQDDGRTSGLRR